MYEVLCILVSVYANITTAVTTAAYVGVADHFAEDDTHALEIARSIMAGLNVKAAAGSSDGASSHAGVSETVCQETLFGPDDMGSVIPADPKRPFDVRKVTHHTCSNLCEHVTVPIV